MKFIDWINGLSTLFYADDGMLFSNLRFENDVKMYGTQTGFCGSENVCGFENDVKMYGTQTDTVNICDVVRLRMM